MLLDERNRISPITGGKASLHWELQEIEFRKELYKVMVPYYVCEDTGERFTTTESDGVWMAQLRSQYCGKYGIPFTDEIVGVREKYGISALKMSLILGFGENQWRKYEQEEIPSLSNGKMIRSIMNPNVFLDCVESSKEVLSEKEYAKISARVKDVIASEADQRVDAYEKQRIFGHARSLENGYAPISLARLKNILLYVLQYCGDTFCTKMNKILFYIDFLSYRERGMAMTGLSYRAIDHGPVPERWDRVYSQFDEVCQESRTIGNYEGNVLSANADVDSNLFSAEEMQILECVCSRFKHSSSKEISTLSHGEDAWIDCIDNKEKIPFSKAFTLKTI